MKRHSILRWSLVVVGFALASALPSLAHEGHHHNAMGTIRVVGEAQLDLETKEGKLETFQLADTTAYKRGDAAAKREDLKVGERAVVMYEKKDGKNVAIEVKVAAGHDEHHGHGMAATPAEPGTVPAHGRS
jgi:hypothetical protein